MPAEESIVVQTAFLRDSFNALIDHIEVTQGSSIKLESDYFWSIPSTEIYNVRKTPTDLTIGQITESLENLRSQIDDPEGRMAWGLVWLGDVLKAAGHKLVG